MNEQFGELFLSQDPAASQSRRDQQSRRNALARRKLEARNERLWLRAQLAEVWHISGRL